MREEIRMSVCSIGAAPEVRLVKRPVTPLIFMKFTRRINMPFTSI